ncbi:hypothetical protein BHM03_00062349, partial [Ensete ventricosum]
VVVAPKRSRSRGIEGEEGSESKQHYLSAGTLDPVFAQKKKHAVMLDRLATIQESRRPPGLPRHGRRPDVGGPPETRVGEDGRYQSWARIEPDRMSDFTTELASELGRLRKLLRLGAVAVPFQAGPPGSGLLATPFAIVPSGEPVGELPNA